LIKIKRLTETGEYHDTNFEKYTAE